MQDDASVMPARPDARPGRERDASETRCTKRLIRTMTRPDAPAPSTCLRDLRRVGYGRAGTDAPRRALAFDVPPGPPARRLRTRGTDAALGTVRRSRLPGTPHGPGLAPGTGRNVDPAHPHRSRARQA